MTNDTMIGVDLAKSVFQLHAASATGQLLFRKKLSRSAFAKFMAEHPPATIVMEACGSAHYWARELAQYGHEVKLIAAQYVRPFVKRQKNDAADAEAIVIAAQRPEMRFVEPKSAEQQSVERRLKLGLTQIPCRFDISTLFPAHSTGVQPGVNVDGLESMG